MVTAKKHPQLYKMLRKDGGFTHSISKKKWSLPKGDKPGDWYKVNGSLIPCENGLHLVDKDQLGDWLDGTDWRVFTVEVKGDEIVKCSDKYVVREARLVKEVTKQAHEYNNLNPDKINLEMDEVKYDLGLEQSSIKDFNKMLAHSRQRRDDLAKQLKTLTLKSKKSSISKRAKLLK
jgi:hypothetical protein